jgi:hypothetical protein
MNPLQCMDCRAGWLTFRRRVDEVIVDAERRGLVIQEYLRLFHEHGHDEDRVRAELERRLTIQRAAALAHRIAEDREQMGLDDGPD